MNLLPGRDLDPFLIKGHIKKEYSRFVSFWIIQGEIEVIHGTPFRLTNGVDKGKRRLL